jgi:hypothetical protein
MSDRIDLDALDAAVAGMTPGEWRRSVASHYDVVTDATPYGSRLVVDVQEHSDAAGIIALRNAAPSLLAELRELRAWRERRERERCETCARNRSVRGELVGCGRDIDGCADWRGKGEK